MSSALVSVLIPCYNAELYVGETIESVYRQTWPNIEIVIVNDGSTDRSVREIERFRSNRLTLLHQSNKGQTTALNTALRAASGDFIQYLDADDLISENKIELQVRRLIEHPQCVATSEWGRFREDVDETRFRPEKVWQDMDPVDWLVESRADGGGMMFPALWLMPKGIVDAVKWWREELTLNNDAEYFTRALLLCDRVLFCGGARCYYRSGIAGSLSGSKSASAWRSQFAVIELCEDYVRTREDSDRVRRVFSLSWQRLAHSIYPQYPELANEALTRAQKLHRVRIRPGGGARFRLLSRLVGWRLARRLQVASGRP